MANQAVYGVLKNRREAEKLVQTLINANVPRQDISILTSQNEEWNEFATGAETSRSWRTEERLTDYPADTTNDV
ncbi:MAG: DUF3341 domain-containing protein, partial [Parachlamydia sp.]|nr:DUF3341 domain-containing protein [Parachlamydia sp.]